MKRSKNAVMGTVCLCVSSLFVQRAEAVVPGFQFMDVGSLGGIRTEAYDINDAGRIVGWGKTPAGTNRAFITAPNAPVNPDTDLIPLLAGGSQNFAYSVNASGGVAGDGNSVNGDRAFRYAGATLDTIQPISGSWSYASKINESGQVVGSGAVSNLNTHATLFKGAQVYDLGTLGGKNSFGYGINRTGVVVGTSERSNNSDQTAAFVWTPTTANGTNGTMTAVGSLGGNYSYANDINDAGGIVGGSTLVNDIGYEAFYRPAGGPVTSLGTLGGSSSEAKAINSSGQIVGYAMNASEASRAFLYMNGVMHDLNELMPEGTGWTLTTARGINDVGQIVGVGRNPLGEIRSFLLTPVSTWAVDASGTWSTASNWIGGVPQVGKPVSFTDAISAPRTITVDSSYVVGQLTFDHSVGYTIQGGSLTVSGIHVRSGSHTISTNLQFSPGAAIAVNDGSTLKLAGTAAGKVTSLTLGTDAKVDLAANSLIIDYEGESPLPAVRAAITQAFSGGAWTGSGITSSLLTSNPQSGFGIGYAEASALEISNFGNVPVDDSTVLVRYTLSGDTNLDGTVNFDDLLRLAQSYGLTGQDWSHGDADYDGAVTFDDFLEFAQNYGATLLGDQTVQWNTKADLEADWALALSVVPEPSLACLTAATGCLIRRRRGG